MRVFIRNDYESLSQFAATLILDLVNDNAQKLVNVAFPAGYTVKRTYELLAASGTSLANVRAFHIDEFIGLDADDDKLQRNWMYDNLYSKVDIKTGNVHYLDPNAADLQEECARFEALISSHGGLDLAFFGTGADGHVARNEVRSGEELKSPCVLEIG